MSKGKFIVIALFALIVLLMILKQDPSQMQRTPLEPGSKIVAFGDSLTYGKGATMHSYPIQLQMLLNLKVINEGQSGEPSSKGLIRLVSVLEEHKPDLIILCHGGNDLIQQTSKETLRSNIIKMIRLSKQSGAEVLLVGVPNFKLIRFSTEPLYEEIAKEEGIMYEGDILSKIENDTSLKSDRIHPNARGYGLMAEAFYKTLKDNGLL